MAAKGFTLPELMLTLAVMSVIAGFSVPFYIGFKSSSDLRDNTAAVLQLMRRAQSLSRAVADDSNWGVYIELTKITLFKGSAFEDRDRSADEVIELPGGFNFTTSDGAVRKIVFSRVWGFPLGPENQSNQVELHLCGLDPGVEFSCESDVFILVGSMGEVEANQGSAPSGWQGSTESRPIDSAVEGSPPTLGP